MWQSILERIYINSCELKYWISLSFYDFYFMVVLTLLLSHDDSSKKANFSEIPRAEF